MKMMIQITRSKFFVPALLLTLTTGAVRFDDKGATWMWLSQPWVAVLIGAVAVAMWVLVGRDLRSRESAR